MLRSSILFTLIWLALTSVCAALPDVGITSLNPRTLSELQDLLNNRADVDQFRLRGPFAVTVKKNYEVRLSASERIITDLYLSAPDEKAPLVIILHGYASSKEAHSYQAMHLASWGMHSLVLQLPNKLQWVGNGKTMAKLVKFIYRLPKTIDSRVDVNKIILVGHSFGGTAVTIALAEGAPAAGGILLDPATLNRDLPKYLRQIKKPVVLLGADEHVYSARNRGYFYQYIRSGIAEVSITNATHEDAQYPAEAAFQIFGIVPPTTEELQVTFVSALTAAAFSLAAWGNFDYAWRSFGDVIENGRFYNAKRK